jgi:hypothetical protein
MYSVGTTLSAFVVPITGLIVTYIAVAQYFINRRQYRLALFEKRMAVYNATMNMIASVMRTARPTLEQNFQYLRDARDHQLLFGLEVSEFIDQVYINACHLWTHNEVGAAEASQAAQVMEWFAKQIGEANKVFIKYLDFRKP